MYDQNPSLLVPLELETDVELARSEVRAVAQAMGFAASKVAEIGLGVSEIAQNALRHGGGGHLVISTVHAGKVLRIEISDQGQGITNVAQAMREGFSTIKTSLGVGLEVAKNTMDKMEIVTTSEQGTTILLEKKLPTTDPIMDNFTETYDFLVAVIGNVPFGIIAIDLEGEITMCNELALQHLAIAQRANRLVEMPLLDYIQAVPQLVEVVESCLKKGRKPFNLTEIAFKDAYLNIRGRRILNGMIITIEDITKAKNAQLDNFSAMLEGQEIERRRLAKEIHDGIGPLMSTIKLNLDGLKNDVDVKEAKATKKIVAMEELVQSVSTDLRSISHALMPSALVDFGLVMALQNLCSKANDSGKVNIEFYHSGMKERLPQNIELSLFRITQELLNNAFKYAQAETISVQLIQHPDAIMLTVEDDGVGFDPQKLADLLDKGIGLQNIQTRVKTLEGTLNIETQLGRGVMTTIEVPI